MSIGAPAALALRLDGSGRTGDLVGGKGAWLDRLVAEGFEVPETTVVTTEAYRRVVGDEVLRALLDRLRVEAPAAGDRELVDQAFLDVVVPPDVSDAIAEAASGARGAGGALLAVRSSATAEDMHATSFAGQYRSFLEVGDDRAVERAVRLVWASLWHPAPRAYRRANGIDETDLAMAAVLMRMVPAERAGVAFTVDPGGEPDVVRVEAVEGYAEGLVSGARTPTVHLVARVPAAREAVDPVLGRVADLALRAEDAFGCPQDVEWAWDGERLLLVQARPITAAAEPGDGFDSELADDRQRTTAGIAEMLPGVLPPLVWGVGSFAVEEGFRSLLDQLGALPSELVGPTGILGRTRGRAVMDLSLMQDVAGALPGGSADEVEAQYFGSRGGEGAPAAAPHPSGRGLRAVAHDVRVVRARRLAIREAEVCEVATEATVEAVADPAVLTSLDDTDLLALHRRVLDLLARTVAAEMAVAAAGVAAYRRLELLLLRHLDEDDAARWAQRVTSAAGGRTGWTAARLAELRSAFDGPDASAVRESEASWARAAARLDATDGGREARAAFEAALRRVGSKAVPAGRTWLEDPQPVWDLLRAPLPERSTRDPADAAALLDQLAHELRSLPGWRPHRILTGGIVDARLSGIRRAADDALRLLTHREDVKADVLALGGVLRAVHLEVGRRLVVTGALDAADDVDLLGLAELGPALVGRAPTRAVMARRRHWMATCAAAGPLPSRFVGAPESVRPELPAGDLLVGWGAGPGVARGPARVLEHPEDPGFERGAVLVARATDASWSPLFLRAGAIVVEEGGPLSHAAIIARELGIPAVLNLPGVVDRVAAELTASAGSVDLTVDGDQGLVVIERPQREEG